MPDTVPVFEFYETVREWFGDPAMVPLGVGHLRPDAEPYVSGWEDRIRLPLFAEPGGKPWGWIVNGWIADLTHPGEVPAPLGTTGLVETAYETATFIVLEARDDGWLRFRYARPDSTGPDGTAWTPACALSLGAVAIRYQPWSERLMQTEIGPLHARDERLPTTLYAEPTPDAPVRATLTGFDYHLEPLEIRGDWMRVRLKQPSDYCGEPETPPAVTEGWIRWWSSERGPLVWYYTRGC